MRTNCRDTPLASALWAIARITPSGLSSRQPSPYAFGIGQSSFGGLGRRARYAITFWFGSRMGDRPKGAAKRGASSRGSFRVTHCPRTLSGRKRNLSTHCPLKNEAGLLQRVPVSTDRSTKQSLPHFFRVRPPFPLTRFATRVSVLL
jgi:hypothetical protein